MPELRGKDGKRGERMKCPHCNITIKYSPALKSALRKGPVNRVCTKCGKSQHIEPGDVTDPIEDRAKKQYRWNY